MLKQLINNILFFSLILFIASSVYSQKMRLPERAALHAKAVEESLIPIRPGIPGKSPFWNTYARWFIYAPAFDIKPFENATCYRFTAVSEKDKKAFVFEALELWAPLVPIWKDIPVGYVNLTVEGLNKKGSEVIGVAGTRRFYRAVVYNGPYRNQSIDYRESGLKALRYLFNSPIFQYWKTKGKPFPDYKLYCYPSKMLTSVMQTMITYRTLTENTTESNDALLIAKNAGLYLIEISMPPGSPLEFFLPTYTGQRYNDMKDEFFGEPMDDRIMLIYPASAGNVYLDMYDVTHDKRFLEAARRIAGTYKKIQLSSGTWYLLMNVHTGKPLADNVCMPGGIAGFLERLADRYGMDEFQEAGRKARWWTEENAAKEFNWEAQFEDQPPVEKYKNLTKDPAVAYAMKLFDTAKGDSVKITEAEELLRFAEDQFVVWEQPPEFTEWDSDSILWITPCVLEQYNFYVPVDASAALMIRAFKKAYDVTGKPLYLAKALDLANSMTAAQDPETGRYPTYWERGLKLGLQGWINCAAACARTMIEFGEVLEASHKND